MLNEQVPISSKEVLLLNRLVTMPRCRSGYLTGVRDRDLLIRINVLYGVHVFDDSQTDCKASKLSLMERTSLCHMSLRLTEHCLSASKG